MAPGELLRSFGRVTREVFCGPTRWRPARWALAVGIGSATWLAYLEKWPVQGVLQGRGDGILRELALLANLCGSGVATASLGVVALLVGLWRRRPALVETAIALGAAGFWCWIFTRTGQVVFAEQRPNDGGAMHFFATDGHGVSGHASAAALLCEPVHDILARGATPRVRRGVRAGLIAWALFVAWSRVWLGMHFVWNVVLGLAIGFFTGSAAARALPSPRSLIVLAHPSGASEQQRKPV
jgi:membrane-associated phospholipid phosphatase